MSQAPPYGPNVAGAHYSRQPAPTEQKRRNFCGMFIGTNRTGKSATAKIYAEKWRANNPKGKIIAFDPQNNFSELANDVITINDKNWGDKVTLLRNGLLIMDDYRLLHGPAHPHNALIQLMNFRAKWNVDVIFVTHSPSLVLNYLTYYITDYYIFRTLTQKDSFERKIPNYELCQKASLYINAYTKHCGLGAWPKFPHIIVSSESDDLTTQNIDAAKFAHVLNTL